MVSAVRSTTTPAPPSDQLLLRWVGREVSTAFDDLVERHREPVARFVDELTEDAADTAELVSASFDALRERITSAEGTVGAIRPFLLAHVIELFTGQPAGDPVASGDPSCRGWDDLDLTAQTALWHTDVEGEPASTVAVGTGVGISDLPAVVASARTIVRETFLESHMPRLARRGCRENWLKLTTRPHEGLADAAIEEHAGECEGCGPLLLDARLTMTSLGALLATHLLGPDSATVYAALIADAAACADLRADAEDPSEDPAAVAGSSVEPAVDDATVDEVASPQSATAPASEDAGEPRPAPLPVAGISGASAAPGAAVPVPLRRWRERPGVFAPLLVAASVAALVSVAVVIGPDGQDAASDESPRQSAGTTFVNGPSIAPAPVLQRRDTPDASRGARRSPLQTPLLTPESLAPTPFEPNTRQVLTPSTSTSTSPSPTAPGSESPSESPSASGSPTPTTSESPSTTPSESPTETTTPSESPTPTPTESTSPRPAP